MPSETTAIQFARYRSCPGTLLFLTRPRSLCRQRSLPRESPLRCLLRDQALQGSRTAFAPSRSHLCAQQDQFLPCACASRLLMDKEHSESPDIRSSSSTCQFGIHVGRTHREQRPKHQGLCDSKQRLQDRFRR